MKPIENSPEIKAIEAMKFPGRSIAKKQRGHKDYLLSREEQFARAYAQWIAERTGGTKYLNAMELRRNEGWGCAQWQKEAFAPIAAEFEKLFKAKGWLR